ncbi:hypothetical protein BJX99DRAFT_239903 [Aspergillus californicus]
MSIYESIAATKERHSQILADLEAVDRAPDALRSHQAYYSDLQRQFTNTSHSLEEIRNLTRSEREKHERYRDSTIRRLLYRTTGKRADFEERADQEMKKYYIALERENETKGQKEMLEGQIAEAANRLKELRGACAHRSRLNDELETIYKRLFEGPTEDFPEEDAQEEATNAARTCYKELSGQLDNVHQAAQCLGKAQLTIKEALLSIYEAIRHCERDIWGFGGILADMGQQDCLSRAQQKVSQTQMLVSQAMRLDRHVQALPTMRIVQHDMISSIIFDNAFYNISFLNMVQQSFDEVKHAEQVLGTQLRRTKSRAADLQLQADQAKATLDSAQKDLRKIREESFIKAADPPPAYTEKLPIGLSDDPQS